MAKRERFEELYGTGITHDGVKFAETVLLWDNKLHKVVKRNSTWLVPQNEIEERIARRTPIELVRCVS